MKWLNLDYDEGPVYQMDRLERYREVVDQMLADGRAYYCYRRPRASSPAMTVAGVLRTVRASPSPKV